jgi:hypothetical protein
MEKVAAYTERTTAEGGWRAGNPATGERATPMLSDYFNMVQEEFLAILAEAEIDPDIEDNQQLVQSILVVAGVRALEVVDLAGYLKRDASATLTAGFNTEFLDLTVAGGVASFDPTARSRFKHTLTGAIIISNPAVIPSAGPAMLKLTQDATGNRAVDWGSKYRVVGTVNYDANSVSLCHLQYDAADDVIDVVITHRPEA